MKKTFASVLAFLLVLMMVFAGVAPTVAYAAESRKETKSFDVSDAVDTLTEWVEVDRQGNELVLTLNPDFEAIKSIDSEDVKAILDKILHYAKDAIVKAIDSEEFQDILWSVAKDAYLTAKGYDSIAQALDDPELPRELVGYARDVIIAAHNAGIIDVDDIKSYVYRAKYKIAALFDNLQLDLDDKLDAYIKEKSDEIYACFEGSVTEIVYNLIHGNVLPGTDLSLAELVKKIDEIRVNGFVLYNITESGKAELNFDGIKGLILSIPRFADIYAMSEEDMKFSFNVAVDTEYGSADFGVTAKIGSGYEYVKAAAAFLDRYFDLDIESGNTVVFNVNMPAIFTKAILKAANTDLIDPILKQKVFGAFTATGNDVHALIKSLSYNDLLTLLECIDFEGIFNHDFVQQFVDLSAYTNEEIKDIVVRYEKYFTAAIKYGARFASAVLNRVPDKYMDNSFMDLIEYEDENDKFSYANGTFSYEGTHTLTYEFLEEKLVWGTNVLGVDELYAYMFLALLPDSFVENGFTASLDFSINFQDINRVDYVVDGKVVRSGFLPAGAKVKYFAEVNNTNISYWIDSEGNPVTVMPDHDTVLYAVYDGQKIIDLSDLYWFGPTDRHDGENQIIPVYDGEEYRVYLESGTFDLYELFNVELDGHVAINAGNYTAVVKSISLKDEYKSQYVVIGHDAIYEYNWKIDPKVVDVETAFEWTSFENFVYNGNPFKVEITNLPTDLLEAAYFGNVETNASGEAGYVATAKISPIDKNYVLPANQAVATYTWYIAKDTVTVTDVKWNYTEGGLVYNKTEQGIFADWTLSNESVRDVIKVTYENNTATNVGEFDYEATVSFALDGANPLSGNYILELADGLQLSQNWNLLPVVVTVTDLAWNYTELTFNNETQTVELLLPEELKALIADGDVELAYTGNTAKDAASDYVATATFKVADGCINYVIDGDTYTYTLDWAIAPVVVDVTDLAWNYESAFLYNGSDFTVALNVPAELQALIDAGYVQLVYTGNTAKDAASDYVATATFNIVENCVNYVIEGGTYAYTLDWAIAPIVVDVTDLVWNYESAFLYNGSDFTVALNVPAELQALIDAGYVQLVYTGNTAKDAASDYVATATFSIVENCVNYVIEGGTYAYTLDWAIDPIVVNISGLEWNYTSLTYNGSVQGVVLTVPAELQALIDSGIISLTYSGNTATDAGEYVATATVAPINTSYVLAGSIESLNWEIAKVQLDGSSIKLDSATFTYDARVHSLVVTGDASVLEKLDIKYTGNDKTFMDTYTVTAVLTVKEEYAKNYVFYDELTATLTIKGDPKNVHILNDGLDIIVKVEGALSPDNLIAGGIADGVKDVYEIDGKDAELLAAYDIYFTKGADKVSVDGQTFKVRLLIPVAFRNLDAEDLMVIYIKDDGSVEVMNATRDNDYMVFETNHFSKYAIVRVTGPNLTWLWILLAVLLVAGIAVGVYFFLKSKKNNEPAPDEIPAVEEAPVAEEPVEEPVEIVEEEPVVEEAEEILEVDEVVAEQTEEEIPEIDEEVAEEEDSEVADEEALAEDAIDEINVQVVEEQPEEPKTAVLVMGEDGKEATAIIGGEVVHIRFRSSFMSRLIQSTENIQCFYSEIKNHVLSYKGIKARGSWNYEAFNKGRTQLVKLNIKGKTLIVNLNLDPKEFNINKYHFIDCSDKPKFDKVPMMMKVRSARALKYTLELIDEMMSKYEIAKGDVPTVDYRAPYETTEELAKRGLVKVILPAGVTLSDDMTLVHVNVSELIESGASEKSIEQLMVGEKIATEETPAVEEAPAVEEVPAVEEAPIVEEKPAEHVVEILEDGTVHADATVADQLITDEEAEAKIEVVSVAGAKRSGKMGEINLDTICENFEDDEVVDVDSLKAKRLISPKIGRVKVLARGIMYKRLTVKASKFSIQAVKMITLAGGKVELEE